MIPGLILREDFIEETMERNLLRLIDAGEWNTDLRRRVQHYGWRYDYTARRIDTAMFLGPLPDWLGKIAESMKGEFGGHVPDQVIVNEYDPGQGISKHIDCRPCFGPEVASLSLGSGCVMEFERKGDRVPIYLPRRSLVVVQDEARNLWTHAIPARKTDVQEGVRLPRGRRVSLTFRTIIR